MCSDDCSTGVQSTGRNVRSLVLCDSGGVVNSFDFCPASLRSLGSFTMEVGDSEFANFTLPALKAFLEARSHVSGNKQ